MNLLSEIETKHLVYLAEILDFGTPQLQAKNADPMSLNGLQKFLLFNLSAVHNYSEAIHQLCKDARPHPAFVLLRSVFEAYINAAYIKIGDSKRKLALFAKEGFRERAKIAHGFADLFKEYPERENTLKILKVEQVEKLRKFAEEHIEAINGEYGFAKKENYPSIIDCSKEVDQNATDPADIGEAELYYHLVYRYLSPYAHLNAYGLEMFVDQGTNGGFDVSLGQKEGVNVVILQTYGYYFVLLNDLFTKEVLLGEMPAQYKTYLNEMRSTKI